VNIDSISRVVVPWLLDRRRTIAVLALLVGLTGLFFSVRLYGDLRSDVEELLPSNAPSVLAAHEIAPKVHNVAHLSIVLESGDSAAKERFADALVARLRTLPPDMVDSVEYRVDEQRAFVRQFGAMYVDRKDLKSIVDNVHARVAWERRHSSDVLNLLGNEDDPEPKVDFSAIEKKYAQATGSIDQFRDGYFETPDGGLLAILVRPPESNTTASFNKRLLSQVQEMVRQLDPHKYDPTMRVGYDGEVASLVEEHDSLASDIVSSSVVVVVMVTLALWLYYRRWSVIGPILLSLAVACFVTFGLGFFLVGHLNANTAFLGSIVAGNGINVSLVFAARYLEERRHNVPAAEAIRRGWAGTMLGTFVASFGAALAYFALVATDFRGFNQFGRLGCAGMIVCWVLAYLLLPPLLYMVDGERHVAPVGAAQPLLIGRLAARWVLRHAGVVRLATALVLALSVVGLLTYRGDPIEYDLSKLRARRSGIDGTIYWGKQVDKVFQAYLTPFIIRADTPADLDRVVARLDARRASLGEDDPIREVRTVDSLLPQDQAGKVALVRTLQEELPPARVRKLDPDTRATVERFLPRGDVREVTLADVPATIRLPLVERDGSVGRIALAFPRHIGMLQPREVVQLSDLIRGAIAESGGHAQAVGQLLLFGDIARAIWTDGPKAAGLAFALVCALVLLAYRSWRPRLEVLASLLLGVAWLVGLSALLRVRLNFLNFVVFPITFGIGVDYAANIIQRYRTEGSQSLDRVLQETGSAVALCSATTIIGYSSLLLAKSQALSGFGLMASFGEVACLSAALLALPVWLLRPPAAWRIHKALKEAKPRTGARV
jgi:predicted RND superfamily exporter protein